MADVTFAEIINLGERTIEDSWKYIGENNTPLLNKFYNKKRARLTEFGLHLPLVTKRPGGHNFYGQDNPDFRLPTPIGSDKMQIYPTWYQIGMTFNGATLRGLKRGEKNYLINFNQMVKMLTDSAKKRMNHIMHGDGTGAIGVCGSVITGTGSVSLTCLTLATSGAGESETKGGVRLEKDQSYAIINPSNGNIKAVFTVTTPSRTAPTVNVTNHFANTASGDPIVDLGASAGTLAATSLSAYKKAFQGLRSLCSASGYLQGINRADYLEYKTPRYNGNDQALTPAVLAETKTYVNIGGNDMNEANGKLIVMTPGQQLALRIQQFGYRRLEGNETVKGVAKNYVDADGDQYLFDADGAEDRVYILDDSSFYMGEEKPFGLYNEDGNELRMMSGFNGVGKDAFYMAIGWGGNFLKNPQQGLIRCDAYIDRLAQTGIVQQTSF